MDGEIVCLDSNAKLSWRNAYFGAARHGSAFDLRWYDGQDLSGGPNDDPGYTTNGGWLCPAHRQIEFTPEEKRALAEGITKAAGRDWEPVDTCVADIADYCASSIADPIAIDSLDPDSVAECFSDPENWKSYDEAK